MEYPDYDRIIGRVGSGLNRPDWKTADSVVEGGIPPTVFRGAFPERR